MSFAVRCPRGSGALLGWARCFLTATEGRGSVARPTCATRRATGAGRVTGDAESGHAPVGYDWGSSNLMAQSGKHSGHGQRGDWQFIGSTGCGRRRRTGGESNQLARRESPFPGTANGWAGAGLDQLRWPGFSSPSLAAAPSPGPDRVELSRRRSKAECVRPPRGVWCLRGALG